MPIYPSVIQSVLFVDPIATYGVAFDHVVVFDGTCSTGAPTKITSATINFTNADLNKRIVLSGAGAAGAQYVGAITAIDSATQVTVSPSISTTVSNKGLQTHTDDLAAWTALISDINNSPYPGAQIQLRQSGNILGFTNRSGISSYLPEINKQIKFEGISSNHNTDIGDYTKVGGSCIAYVGTTAAPTDFSAVMTLSPTLGVAAPALKRVVLKDFWIDCRNGDQNSALKGLWLKSCHGFMIENFFVMDAAGIAIEFGVVAPGVAVPNANSLGEAKDCTRGIVRNVGIRGLDLPQSGAQTTAITTTSAVTLSNGTPQSLAGLGANTLPTAGYVWVQTTIGYPVLVKYTGGGGTTTLTGCIISLADGINVPATVSGSNIVQACPSNSCAILFSGDLTANTCLIHFSSIYISHGSTWGPAAIEFGNSDSNDLQDIIINGGSFTNDGTINRIRKPGIRINGSNTSATLACRNNTFTNGSAGAGGISNMGVLNTGARLLAMSGPTYWKLYQLGNGEPIPIVEGNAYFDWTPNGGWLPGQRGQASVADQAISAATLTSITGSIITVPPQGIQVGTTFRWIVHLTSGAAGTAAGNVFSVKIGTAGTTADSNVAVFTTLTVGTAVVSEAVVIVQMTIRTLGATATAYASCSITNTGVAGTGVGFISALSQALVPTMSTFNSTTANLFINLCLTTSAAKTVTIRQIATECVNPANP